MFNSIKIKIIIWCLAIFSIVFAGLETFLYFELKGVAIEFVDEHLRSEVDVMAGILRIERSHGQLETELAELSIASAGKYGQQLSGRYYQIVSIKGQVLTTSPSLKKGQRLPIRPATADGLFYNVTGPNNFPLRLISQSVDFGGGLVLVFQVADSLSNTYRLVNSFRKIVLVIYPAVFLICGIGIFFMTKWALRPLNLFASKISHITDKNLYERIDEKHRPVELKDLTSSFNTMLGRLEKSFQRKKEFLSDASHELRTPTSVIKSYCDVMLSREREGAAYKDALTKIGVTVNRMTELINRILVISRIDSNSSELRFVRLGVRDLVSDVFRLVGQAANEKKITLRLHGPEVEIRADKDSLFEVFTNLIENAVKYNNQGGRVDVRISTDNGFCKVSVEDTGMGIDEKDLENIFKRFYRTDASRGLTVGSGLGLSIVNAIVKAHGGHIVVESEKSRGSRFQVFFPMNRSA